MIEKLVIGEPRVAVDEVRTKIEEVFKVLKGLRTLETLVTGNSDWVSFFVVQIETRGTRSRGVQNNRT